MRISDWSSDVCSSDLTANRRWASAGSEPINRYPYCCGAVRQAIGEAGYKTCLAPRINLPQPLRTAASRGSRHGAEIVRSEMPGSELYQRFELRPNFRQPVCQIGRAHV